MARDGISGEDGEFGRKTALVTGSVAVGALLTGSLFRRIRRGRLVSPDDLEPAIDAACHTLEIMEGQTRFYAREGTGIPIVLLHSINAAASSFEMRPLFDHLAASTNRPIYALDWFGFGRSDRPPVRYAPSIYLRQLRRFLSEHVHQPADLIALSLSCEYAAELSRSLPYLVRKIVFIAPTGLARDAASSTLQRVGISIANSVGAFEILFYRLTREEVLRRFYARQVFQSDNVPEELVAYASKTTQVRGAHHAPRYFVQGRLTTASAERSYAGLHVPTRIIVPADTEGLIQQFDLLEDVVARNSEYLHVHHVARGLLPHWEVPSVCFDVVDDFLTDE